VYHFAGFSKGTRQHMETERELRERFQAVRERAEALRGHL
jgi:hypothetical protein